MSKRFYVHKNSEIVDEIRRRYPDTPTDQLADDLGLSVYRIYYIANKIGVRKSPEFMGRPEKITPFTRGGVRTRFKKGNRPWNAGKKGVSGNHPNSRRTQFKKGNRPVTEVAVGSERIDREGYTYIKVQASPPKWKLKHVWIWEQHNGPIPNGYVVVFRDGNKQNFSVENLELITRRELMNRNSLHRLPPEIKELALAVGSFKRKITLYAKKQNR